MNSLCEREKKMRKLLQKGFFYGNRILATFIEWTEDNCGQLHCTPAPEKISHRQGNNF